MIKKTPFLLILLLSVWALPSFSQIGWDSLTIQSKNRFFIGLTYDIIPDIEKGPMGIYPYYLANFNTAPPYPQEGYSAIFVFTTNFASLGGKLRYNVIQFNSRISLSLSTAPSLGVGLTVVDELGGRVDPYANFTYNIPMLLEFNYGNGATPNTMDEYGLFALAGVENTGLLLKPDLSNYQLTDANGNNYAPAVISSWTEPVFGLGIRYRNSKNKEREVFLKYGVAPEKLYITPYGIINSSHPWTLKLTFVHNL